MLGRESYPMGSWMNVGFYLVAFFASISISLSQLGLGIIIIAWIAIMIREKKFIIFDTPMAKPILIYLVAMIISSVFGGGIFRNLVSIIHNHWIMLILFATVTFVNDEDTIKKLVYATLGGALVASLYGITQGLMGGLDIVRPVGEKIIIPDAIGFFNHHLTYAEVMLFSLFISLSLLLFAWERAGRDKGGNGAERLFYIVVFLLSMAALLFSQTRSSWLGFFVAMFLLPLAVGKKKVTLVCILISLSFMSLLYLPKFSNRAYSIAADAVKVDQTPRYFIWKTGIKLFRENPITGVGTDNWPQAVAPYAHIDPVISNHAHNNFIHQAATMGIIGLSAFIYLWVVLFREGFFLYRHFPDDSYFFKGLILGGLAGIVAFHVAGLFECSFNDSEVAMLAWFVTGLIFASGKLLYKRAS